MAKDMGPVVDLLLIVKSGLKVGKNLDQYWN
jgi:hypothetical protein